MEFYGYEEQGLLEELLTTSAAPMATTTTTMAPNDHFCNNITNGWNQFDYCWADSNSLAELLIPQTSCFVDVDQGSSYNNFLVDDHHHQQTGLINSSSSTTTSSSSSSFNELLLYTPSFSSDDLLLLSPPPQAPAPVPVPSELEDTPPFLPSCKMEPIGGDVIFTERRINKPNNSKKLNGQPSKNLMAERRRRKRLNDRLSMLRSVVPKISKMDRTSILGDTIDYMKELLERIHHLQEEQESSSYLQQPNLMGIFKDSKPNEALVRNSPKFDVERRNSDTRIEICCTGKTGLLLSTLTTLEALGLEIQHCVISCFNDFSVQASCSEEMEQREFLSSEDIKQALFRNAGYGGRCL